MAQKIDGAIDELIDYAEELDDAVFGLGQMNECPGNADLAAVVIDDQIAEDSHAAGCRGHCALACDPQGSPNPGQQFPGAEGFGDVIVGTQIQRIDLVPFLGAGRQNQDGCQTALADSTDEILSVHIRQTQIQNHQVRNMGGKYQNALLAALGGADMKWEACYILEV